MPIAPVNGTGTVLHYEDNGPPGASSDYTTLVIIHGVIFHGEIFKRILPYATQNNLRIVRLNMRDYPGSSPYTPEEYALMTSKNVEDQRNFVKQLGEEVANFLEWFIQTKNISHIVEGVEGAKATGGIALATWSMSSYLSLSLLAYADAQARPLLERYLRKIILYDPAALPTGVKPAETFVTTPISQAIQSPARRTDITPLQRAQLFSTYVSTYLTPIVDLENLTPEQVVARSPVLDDPTKTPTVERISKEELESMTDMHVVGRSHDRFRGLVDVFTDNLHRALQLEQYADADAILTTAKGLRDAEVVVIWCDMSMNDCVWAARTIQEKYQRAIAETSVPISGEGKRRKVVLRKYEGANHFAHWDDAERFMRILSSCI
ncbi:hypothetical protein K474DRAFT_656021 [Panus rudis PR-1116 ss-1]|nr:hypothetical protein K474DRAFT_656021 [Panus rudis PR-1116 ss-1]